MNNNATVIETVNANTAWTKSEILLAQLAEGTYKREFVAEVLGRTPKAVSNKLSSVRTGLTDILHAPVAK